MVLFEYLPVIFAKVLGLFVVVLNVDCQVTTAVYTRTKSKVDIVRRLRYW